MPPTLTGAVLDPNASRRGIGSWEVVSPATPTRMLGPKPASCASTRTLVEAADVTVTVYDLLGRAVQTVVQGALVAGTHRASVDGARLAPGTYVVRAVVHSANSGGGPVVETARLTIVR